jgi:hypothetical protein
LNILHQSFDAEALIEGRTLYRLQQGGQGG